MALIVEVQQSYVARADRKYTEFVPAAVVARGRANYVVIDTETGRAPEGLNLARLGNDLQITRGEDEVFIKDYFVYEGSALIGPVGVSSYATYENPGFDMLEWMGLRDGLQLKSGESTRAELSEERLEASWLAADNSSSAFSSLLIPVLTSVAATVVGFFAIQQASDSEDDNDNNGGGNNALRAPTELVVADNGLSVSGEGSPGSGITVFDLAGNRLGASTVSGAGTFTVNLALPQTAGQSLNVRAAIGDQVSSLVPITAPVGQNGPISPVVDLDPANNVVTENSAVGTTVGITAQASDLEAISYALVNNPSQFNIDPLTGIITTSEVLDFEAAATYAVTVRATSADGSFNDANFNINVTNVNDNAIATPTDVDDAENQIDATEAPGSSVGVTVRAIDADGALNQVRYELLDNADGRFNINATTGQILTATDLSGEVGTYQVQAQASSSDGSVSQAFFTIDVVTADQSQSAAVI